MAWTFDELYGRDNKFLDGLEELDQSFVAEVPTTFHGWVIKPEVRVIPRRTKETRGRKSKPKVVKPKRSSEVCNLLKYSPALREKRWERYRIKDTTKGPQVWEVKWCSFWRKSDGGLPTKKHCLIVARNVETKEIKYFVSNLVPGVRGATVRQLLSIAFSRWSVESCFRTAKEELGLDHFEVRGWRCIHRHWRITQLAQLFCARVRQEFDPNPTSEFQQVTMEQVRSAMNAWLTTVGQTPKAKLETLKAELDIQAYYQKRNEQARKSHTKTKRKKLTEMRINPDKIKSCKPKRDQL